MKTFINVFLLFIPSFLFAQNKGIDFNKKLSWTEVQATAKAENKYIFLDCFSVYCGPCVYMVKNVFPQEEAGRYMNEHFINVELMIDSVKTDDPFIQQWHRDAKDIVKKYEINIFPTFLFFSPDGKLVRRVIGGVAGKDAVKLFIEKCSAALDPDKQYYTLLERYKSGAALAPDQLLELAVTANGLFDTATCSQMTAQYIATQKNLFTKQNLDFLNLVVTKSTHPQFGMFTSSPGQIDKILGAGAASRKITSIIIKEEIRPFLAKNKTSSPDWGLIESIVEKKYSGYGKSAVAEFKVQYYGSKGDWNNFQQSLVTYVDQYGSHLVPEELNNYAWAIFENSADTAIVKRALSWSDRSLKNGDNPLFLDTYANILYKMGNNADALRYAEKALALSNGDPTYQKTIDNIKKGQKTWKN